MNSLSEADVDAIAIKLLDSFEGGDYAYEEGVKKTDKQKNLKRYFKNKIQELVKQNDNRNFFNALHEALVSITINERHSKLIKELSEYKKRNEAKASGDKCYYETLHKERIREEERLKLDQEREERINGALKVNQLYRKAIEKLEHQIDTKTNQHTQDMKKAQDKIYELQTSQYKAQKSKKALKREAERVKFQQAMKQLESSDEEDEEDIEIITEEL